MRAHRLLVWLTLAGLAPAIPLGAQDTYRALGRRDPFAPLVVASPPSAPGTVTRRVPGLAGLAVADVVLTGVIASGPTRLALLQGADGRTYLARQQERLQDAVVHRIDADAVILMLTTPPRSGPREIRKPLRPTTADGGGV